MATNFTVVGVPAGHERVTTPIADVFVGGEYGYYVSLYGIRLRTPLGGLGSTIAYGGAIDDYLGCAVFLGEQTDYSACRDALIAEAKTLGLADIDLELHLDVLRREANKRDIGDRNGAPV